MRILYFYSGYLGSRSDEGKMFVAKHKICQVSEGFAPNELWEPIAPPASRLQCDRGEVAQIRKTSNGQSYGSSNETEKTPGA